MQIFERKYFEHTVKQEIFWTKLNFKAKEQQRDFMISFEAVLENIKGTYLSA